MITIKQIQDNATVTDGTDTVILGAGDSYTCSEPEEKLDFIFTVDTTIVDNSPSDSFALQFTSNSNQNALINWGDGIEEYLSPNQANPIIHQYQTSGVYDITIRGAIQFRNIYDRKKLIAIKQWGKTQILSLNNTFSNNINLVSVPQNETFISPLDCRVAFNGVPISNFGKIDVSYTSTFQQFFSSTNFDYDIGYWNVANAGTMQNMFIGTSMSQANCDNILVGWTRWANGQANIQLQSNVSLHLGNTTYTLGGDAEAAFNYLVNTLNWTITFG